MQFDPSVFCLPFVLPVESLANDVEDGPLFPNILGGGLPVDLTDDERTHAIAIEVLSAGERLVGADDASSASADIGIAGGAGSGSSLGSKARALPSSKNQKSNNPQPEGFGAGPIARGMAGDTVVANGTSSASSASVAADLAILFETEGWQQHLKSQLDDVRAGISVTDATDGAQMSTSWWLDCRYASLLAGNRRPSQCAPVDSLGSAALAAGIDKRGVLAVLEAQETAQANGEPALPTPTIQKQVRQTQSATATQGAQQLRSSITMTTRPALWGDDEQDEDEDPLTSLEMSDAAAAGPSDVEEEGAAARAERLGRLRAAAVYESIASDAAYPLARAVVASATSAARVAIEASLPKSAPAAAPPAPATAKHGGQPSAAAGAAPLSDGEFDSLLSDLVDAGASSAASPEGRSIMRQLQQRIGGADGMGGASSAARLAAQSKQWAITKRMTEGELNAAESTFSPAHTWPFKLDSFQREAIVHMEREGPAAALFIAAHTSAGKTVVAEYAIAKAVSTRTRAIYTSPIKALSNQKFHDLRRLFGGENGDGVGLITGDVSVHPDAPCLIMTTEILRSMLYRGDDLIRDISWVVFDEIHYINDEQRGLAYEEVLLLLPEHVGLVFLSATSPNREEFAEWIGRTKRKPVYVLGTNKRPVPLNHHLYTAIDNQMALLMDGAQIDTGDTAGFKSGALKTANEKIKERVAKRGGGGAYGPAKGQGIGAGRSGGGATKGDQQTWSHVMNRLQNDDLLPAIVFSFSKLKCEECAFKGLGSVDLTNSREKSAIHVFVEGAVKRLSGSDRTLPQITRLRGLLTRGIGVHHSGLLPILKECVEMLFSRGLVKVLFATETFAMGVNMPARTVLFNGIRKHDGSKFRELTAGEYTQMAGRAGRRGLDTRGQVIILAWGEELPTGLTLQTMMTGKPTRLTSQFRLTYNMMLNVLRTDLPVTSMMAKSYAEFATQRALGGRDVPRLLARGRQRLIALQQEADAIPCIKRGDGSTDLAVAMSAGVDIADIEDAAAGMASTGATAASLASLSVGYGDMYRNMASISQYYDAAQNAQRAHVALLTALLSNTAGAATAIMTGSNAGAGGGGRTWSSVLCAGRVIVVDRCIVPGRQSSARSNTTPGSPATASDGSTTDDAATTQKQPPSGCTLMHVPAVVIAAERRPVSANKVSSATGSAVERFDIDLSVLVLCPPTYKYEARTPGAAKVATAAPMPSAAAASAPAAPAANVMASKKKNDDADDDFAAFSGGAKGKGGGGKAGAAKSGGNKATGGSKNDGDDDMDAFMGGGGSKAKGGGKQQVSSSSKAGSAGLAQASSASSSAAIAEAPAPSGPDFPVALGHFQACNSSSHSSNSRDLTVGIIKVSLRDVGRVTNISLPTGGRYSASAVLNDEGSTLALQATATQLQEVLSSMGAGWGSGPTGGAYSTTSATSAAGSASSFSSSSTEIIVASRAAYRLPGLNPRDLKPPVAEMAITDLYQRAVHLESILPSVKCDGCALQSRQWLAHSKVTKLSSQLQAVRTRYSIEALSLYPEMQARFGILRRLAYTKAGSDAAKEAESASLSAASAPPAPSQLDVVALKGRVACEVNTADELIFTEMLFEGVLNDLSPAECAALLSSLVFQDRSFRDEDPLAALIAAAQAAASGAQIDWAHVAHGHKANVGEDADEAAPDAGEAASEAASVGTPGSTNDAAGAASASAAGNGTAAAAEEMPLEPYAGASVATVPMTLLLACEKLKRVAFALGRLQMEAGLEIVPSEYQRSQLNFGLLLPTYAWACGVPFANICTLTEVPEGTIVRTISRLDETCREVRNAARILGDPLLFRKMETASACIKRDVIFAASLYHTG